LSNDRSEAKNGDKKGAGNGDKRGTAGGERKAANGKAPRRKISAKLSILQDIVFLMDEGGLSELHYEKGDVKIHMKRGAVPVFEMPSASVAQAVPAAPPQAVPAAPAAGGDDGNTVKSPMVGTFYRAPAPDAKPFIQEGGKIEKGQVFCIIEAMKLMNEIKSEVSGKVVKILVENGQVVEFGQPLFVIDPRG